MKQAWDTKKESMEMGGTGVIDQLKEALSASAKSTQVSDDLAHRCLKQCVERVLQSLFLFFSIYCYCKFTKYLVF